MGTHTVHASEYVRQSIVLHEVILKETTIITPRFLPSMLWVVFCLECISVVLYLLSAIPAIRKEGFWLFRTELNGMIRPNTRILLPICVFFYCAFDISALVSLLKDIRRKSLISVSAGGISLITYPLLLCTGWTKIWNILRAVPLTKTVNLMSAFFYGFPLLYGGAPIYLITKEIWRINKTFNEYNRNYMMILSGSINSKEILEFNIEALQQVTSMLDSSNKVLLLARLLSLGYLVYVIMAYVLMLFGYSLILQAVRYQIQTFRKSLEQRIPFDGALHVSSNSISISVSSSCDTPSSHPEKRGKRSWISRNTNVSNWLPTMRYSSELLEKPRRFSSPFHSHKHDSQEWESKNRALIRQQLKALTRYQVNLIWQVCCNTLITASFCGMNIIVGFNLLGVPTHYSLSNLSCFTITWSSVSWVSSWGIPLGLAIFMASFSTPVKALRENTQRVDEEEEDW
ncbi:hypothetical protein PCANC_20301 [Puccinia coronata f. sp. avenae]|uniref:Uncharacterized protein n=1 Tax=Puccinia coronata f. sp. avenae TaxID=200324 RepID=A0A2N5TUD9_9BASI|nr:hypothetical protein PCANC_23468 [Puccinia coronata f. sp. avenae]PLW38974.1 hypothetical protein PCANC_20301 [Puccinia coronata f. sp. avenae]